MTASDRVLVAALKRGDPAAFDRIYDQHRARVFRFLVRLTKSRELAEDLLQETWVRLASKADTLADDTRLGAWLFTVARNLFISHRRWLLIDFDRLRELRLFPLRQDERSSPFQALAASELEKKLEQAIASLPLNYREVILLVGVEHMEPHEAAEVLGLKPEALRQRLARARTMLKMQLEEEPALAKGET